MHLDIGAHGARDEIGLDRQGRQKNKRSRELKPTGAVEEQEIKAAETDRGGKRTRDHRKMIRRGMVRERGYKGRKSARERGLDFRESRREAPPAKDWIYERDREVLRNPN
ncbi:hypothetical protein TNCV_101461 [Trichonephila clavipes]|nr:hypothetical protein TNCV_101461 [Trichonephila clavipes]